jgi:hypothetical protein
MALGEFPIRKKSVINIRKSLFFRKINSGGFLKEMREECAGDAP